MNRRPFNQTG